MCAIACVCPGFLSNTSRGLSEEVGSQPRHTMHTMATRTNSSARFTPMPAPGLLDARRRGAEVGAAPQAVRAWAPTTKRRPS